MATELGKAYVQIIPSAKGIQSNISKELNNHMQPALKSMERNIGQSITNSLSTISSGASAMGSALTNKITKPAIAAVSALGGLTLWKGFGRLKDMDTAQAKLKGIGFAGEELQGILENASDAVLGTSFTTAEAVNVSSTALASGVKPGKELAFYLGAVADAASFANVPLGDMGGIFSKVQAQGKLTGQVVNQLASHGIGIVGILAEETGKSMEEVTASISKGGVSAQDFYNAMSNYMGGAAAEMGGTFDVTFKNIGSRLGILGEKFLGSWKTGEGAFYTLKDSMQEILDFIPTLYDKAEELGEKFGSALSGVIEKVKEIKSWFKGLDEGTQILYKDAIGGFAALAIAIGPALKGFGALAGVGSTISGIFTGLGSSLGGISPMLGGIVSAFSALGPILLAGGALVGLGVLSETFHYQIRGMLIAAQDEGPKIIQNLTKGIVDKLPELMLAGIDMMIWFVDTIEVLLPEIIMAGAEIISALIQGMVENLPFIIESIISLIDTIILALIESTPMLVGAGMGLLLGLGQGLIESAPLLIESMAEIINGLLEAIMESVPMIIEAGVELFTSLVGALPDIIQNIVAVLPEIIENIIGTISELIPLIIDAGIEMLSSLVDALPEIISNIVEALPKIISSIIDAVLKGIPKIIDAGIRLLTSLVQNLPKIIITIVKAIPQIIKSLITALVENIPKIIKTGFELLVSLITDLPKIIVDLVKAMPTIIVEMVKALGKGALEFGKVGLDLIKGLWNGIKDAKNWLMDKIKGLVSSVTDGIKKFFGISSPSKVMADEVGKWLPMGLADGIEDNISPVSRAMDGLAKEAMDGLDLTGEAMEVEARATVLPFENARNTLQSMFNSPFIIPEAQAVTTDNRVINISVDADNLDQLQNVIEIFTGLKQTVRRG